jgi:hypothetical protein
MAKKVLPPGPAPGRGRITATNQPMRGAMERVQGHGRPDGHNSTRHVKNSDKRKK